MASPLADPTKLAGYVGFDVNPARAAALVDQASALIRGLTRQLFDYVTGDTVILSPIGSIALLPELPAVNVYDLQVLNQDQGTWTPFPDRWDYDPDTGVIEVDPLSWWWPRRQRRSVQVTYDHGYTTAPDDLAGACLGLAADLLANPMHLQSTSVGGVSMRFDRPAALTGAVGTDLPASIQVVIDKYTKPSVR